MILGLDPFFVFIVLFLILNPIRYPLFMIRMDDFIEIELIV